MLRQDVKPVSTVQETLPERGARIRLVAMHRNARQPVRELSQIITVLGSGDGCDLILASTKVEAAHAAIVRYCGGAYLCDLGSTIGTTLNGRRIRWARLSQGDVPAIGPFSFRVEIEETDPRPADSPPAFSLRHDQHKEPIRSIDPVLVIGSDPGCDVVLQDKSVSPRHGLVVWTEIGPMVRDLLRRRSVRRNGRRVNAEPLATGDAIGVGKYELTFESATPISADSVPEPAVDESGAEGEEPADERMTTPPRSAGLTSDEHDDPRDDRSSFGDMGIADETRAVDEQETCVGSRSAADRDDGLDDEEFDLGELRSGPAIAPVGETVRDSQTAEARRRRQDLEEREQGLKARVAAAQHALDERARKLWESLSHERQKLKAFQDDLHTKARELLEAAQAKKRELTQIEESQAASRAPATPSIDRVAPAAPASQVGRERFDDDPLPVPAAGDVRPFSRDGEELQRVFGGEFEPEAASLRNAEATAQAIEQMLGASVAPASVDATLREQAGELAELVRREREEMENAEGRLEALRFEISRLQSLGARQRERQHAQETQLENKSRALRTNQAALRQERDELAVRMQLIESREAALRAQLEETDRTRGDLEEQARQLSRLEAEHEERRRELRAQMESERHRLRIRQAELQRKAAELVRAARDRRRAIEVQVAQQKAHLEEQENEIKARRAALEDAGRAELQKTATELEQVLSVRVNEIESELSRRQVELDQRMHDLLAINPLTGQPADPTRMDEPLDATLEQLSAMSTGEIAAASPRIRTDNLQQEVAALRDAVQRLDEPETVSVDGDGGSHVASLVHRIPRGQGWAGMLRARLNQKMAFLRDSEEGPGRAATGSSATAGEADGI